MLYDKLWDKFIDLPKGIQKKVTEFQRKFRENSKSSGIHLEPISTFKDKSLRSARIDQTYRAIIKAPESGDIYYLLWVDHHDKAYDWATNKVFEWNNETQSMQMFTAPEVIKEKEADLIEKQRDDNFFNKFSEDQLLKIGVPEVLLPSISKIDTLDELDELEQYIPSEVFENLFYLLDGANINQLILEVEEGKVKDAELGSQVGSINNQRSFIELTDDSLFNEILEGSLKKWKYYLHPSQRKLVAGHFKGSVKVSGGAGTGKTVAALHRLKWLSDNTPKTGKILFTTYTKALTENLQHLVSGLEIDTSNVTITNIDELLSKLIQDYNVLDEGYKVFEYSSVKKSIDIWEEIVSSELTSYSPEFLEKEFKDVILYNNVKSLQEYLRTSRKGRGKPISRRQRTEIWYFIESFNEIRGEKSLYYRDELYNILTNHFKSNDIRIFDHCLVDELQDFSNIELRFVRNLVAEKPNDLFMVGDPMQGIYDRKITFSKVGINVRGKRSKRLRINYRTTEEIKKLALSIIKDCHYDNFDGEEEEKAGYISLFHGMEPTYEVFKTKDNEVENVISHINMLMDVEENGSQKYNYSDIAICARTKNALKDFRNHLHKEDIPYTEKDSDKKNNDKSVSLLTFHKVKGLEFKHVILVDVNSRSLPKLPFDFDTYDKDGKENHLRKEKSLIYVAITRAIENVKITGVGNETDVIKIG